MVTRNLGKVQEALDALNPVQRNINELCYYKKNLNSPNHSSSLCSSVRSSIDLLDRQHSEVVDALIYYGNTYTSVDTELAYKNSPEYSARMGFGEGTGFTYTEAAEHQKSGWEKFWNQIILGDFSDDFTWAGTVGAVILDFTPIGWIQDGRDVVANISKGNGWGTALAAIGFIPLVSSLGKVGKTAAKSAKVAENVIDGGATAIRQGSNVIDSGATAIKQGGNVIGNGTSVLKPYVNALPTSKSLKNLPPIKPINALPPVSDVSKLGGKYSDIFVPGEGKLFNIHHMPADSTTVISKKLGPSIKMSLFDHKLTASYDHIPGADLYRAKQLDLVNSGKFREALQMDIDDIHFKFGNSYNQHIDEMLKYVEQLIKEGKIK